MHIRPRKVFAASLAGSYARDALGSQLGLSALCPHWHGVQSVCSPQECPLLHPVLPQGLPVPYLCVGGSVASLRYQVLRIVDGTFVYWLRDLHCWSPHLLSSSSSLYLLSRNLFGEHGCVVVN